MSTPLLTVENVRTGYGQGGDVLRGISVAMAEGESLAIIGGNGAGKTTLLRTISGLLPLREGRIAFCGEDVAATKTWRIARHGLAHVPEGRMLFLNQTVEENLRLGSMGRETCRQRIEELLEIFPVLRPKLRQSAGELSGGQQQMVAVARGLMSEPRLLMIDEPSLGLSPKLVDEVAELLTRVRMELGTAVLLVEQNVTIATEVTDRVCVVRRGVVVADAAADVLSDEEVIDAYLS